MITITDAEKPLRDWLRVVPEMTAVVGQRTYAGGFPISSAAYPAVALSRIGGSIDTSTGLVMGLYQFDVAATDMAKAKDVAAALATVLLRATPGELLAGTAMRRGQCEVNSVLPSPDPDAQSIQHVYVTALIPTITTP